MDVQMQRLFKQSMPDQRDTELQHDCDPVSNVQSSIDKCPAGIGVEHVV
jgi:hypothetical protein